MHELTMIDRFMYAILISVSSFAGAYQAVKHRPRLVDREGR